MSTTSAMEMSQNRLSQHTRDVEKLKASLPEGPYSVARPVMVLISGLPGSGKSYFSRRLVKQVSLLMLESDVLRNVLFPIPSHDNTESARLFRACYALVDDLLRRGVPVLLDATNLIEDHRERLYHITDQLGVKLVLISLEAPPGVVYERLKGRSEGADPEDRSTADWPVYQRMFSRAEPIKRNHYVVDSSRDIAPAIAKVAREIKRWMRTLG